MIRRKFVASIFSLAILVSAFPYTPSVASASSAINGVPELIDETVRNLQDTVYETVPLPPNASDFQTIVLNAATGESVSIRTENSVKYAAEGQTPGQSICGTDIYYYSSGYGADWQWSGAVDYSYNGQHVWVDEVFGRDEVYNSDWDLGAYGSSQRGSGTVKAEGYSNGYFVRSSDNLRRKAVIKFTVDRVGNCTARTTIGSW
ncbi:MAG TPA: hypothetical protein VF952_10880 [Chloroflexia bacterium]|jgi:hypothetical protein